MDVERKKGSVGAQTDNSEEGNKASAALRSKWLATVIKSGLFAALGYLGGIATLPFGAQPFGAALLCAASGRYTLAVFAGLCLSAIGKSEAALLIGIWGAALCVRLLTRLCIDTPRLRKNGEHSQEKDKPLGISALLPHLFEEKVILRAASSALCAFALSLISVLKGGFLYYNTFGMILAVITAPLACLVFALGFSRAELIAPKSGERRESIKKAIGIAALCVLAVFTLRGNLFYSISPSAFIAIGAVLFFTRTQGMLFGGIVGLAAGLVYSPMLAPIFVLSAFASGVLFPFSIPLGAWTSFGVGMAWGFYVRGISALSGLFPALLGAALMFTVADKLFIAPALSAKESSSAKEKEGDKQLPRVVPLPESALDTAKLDNTKQKIKSLCETLTALSKSFGEMGKTGGRASKSLADRYLEICDSAFDATCASCKNREKCRETVPLGRVSDNIARAILKNRQVCISDTGEGLPAICERLPDIIDEINHNAAISEKNALECDKSEIFALDYAALANLIAEAQVEEAEELVIDSELTEKLCDGINALELTEAPEGAMVYGKTRRNITIRGNKALLLTKKSALLDVMEASLPFGVDRKSAEIYDGAFCELRVKEAPCLSVSFACKQTSADGEGEVCGDSVAVFKDGEGRFYTCISDGMGSGRQAARVSEICVDFIETMLSSGSAAHGRSAKTVIEMLNGFLQSKNHGSIDEISSTLDLFELDTVNKSAFFCKCGAAPTYVFRAGSLFKIRSQTLPIGILTDVDCRSIRFGVDAGDLIVMLSDGVSQGKEECPWLFDLLGRLGDSVSCETIASRIIKRARAESGADDISVVVMRMEKTA